VKDAVNGEKGNPKPRFWLRFSRSHFRNGREKGGAPDNDDFSGPFDTQTPSGPEKLATA